MILRLFPDARIILALRHPCDVVLQLLRHQLQTERCDGRTSSRLDTAAEAYDLSFAYFEKARELLRAGRAHHHLRELVADRERELRPLLDFLGLEWDERVLDHQIDGARPRPHQDRQLRSGGRADLSRARPAAGSTTASISNRCLPVLEPWVRKFGYSL